MSLTAKQRLTVVRLDATSAEGIPSGMAYMGGFEMGLSFAMAYPKEAEELLSHIDEIKSNPRSAIAREELTKALHDGPPDA